MTPSPAVVKIMEATIHFAFDKSVLTDSARALLDQKVEVFKANPDMSIMMVGYTDVVGKDRLVFGTNFAGWDQPAHIEPSASAREMADNARRLLRCAGAKK